MRFSSFEINKFKGINHLVLDLAATPSLSIHTLVGLNESGKTTILEAIDMFQNDVLEAVRHNLIPRSQSSNFTGNVSVSATVVLEDGDELKIKDFAKNELGFYVDHIGANFTRTHIYEYVGSEYKSARNDWKFELKGRTSKGSKVVKDMITADKAKWEKLVRYINDSLMPRIIYYPNFLFDFPERIYLDGIVTEKDKLYRNMLQDILDSLNEDLTLEIILERIKGASTDGAKKKALDSTLLKMSTQITETVIKPWDSIFSSKTKKKVAENKEVRIEYDEEELESPNPSANPEDPPINSRHYLSMNIKQGSEIYQIEERSLGFKWFFAFLMFTQFRKNRSTEEGETLFLVDEPASNLHSSMQKRLAGEVTNIVDKSKLVFTTHSHHLINPDWLEATYVVRNKALDYSQELDYAERRTDIDAIPYKQFVASHPNQQDYYQPVLDALDYEPSNLEMVDPITIVEGKNDYYVYKYMNSVIFKDKYKLFFYPGNGANGNTNIIRLYLAWGRDFNVLLDADKRGVQAKDQYIDVISNELHDKVITLAEINPSWKNKSIESLFSSKEKIMIIQYLFPKIQSYSKQRFNQSMQNLLFYRKPLKLSKATQKKFETIFSKAQLIKS